MYDKKPGFGFEPVSMTITAGKLAGAAGGLISSIGSIFGYAPRGELQKFQRTHYPYMRTLAAKDDHNVYIWWFGQVVFVGPDGSYGVAFDGTGQNWDWQYAYSLIPQIEVDSFYYVTRNGSADPVNTPSQDYFELMYNGSKVEGGDTTSTPVYSPPVSTPDYTPPIYGPSGQVTPGGITSQPFQAGFAPSGWEDMLPFLLLGGLAAVIAFTGPIKTPTRRARRARK